MKSINQIKEKFNVDENDPNKIRKTLQGRLAKIHPDNNNGEFKSNEDEILFHEISESIDYIDELGKDSQLVLADKMTDMVRVVTELVPKANQSSLETKLTKNIDSAISRYKSRLHLPKLSITALTGILTFLIAFPGQIMDNPTLSIYLDPTSSTFGLVWLSLLIYTGIIWLMAAINEEKSKRKMESFKLDSTQNVIFEDFIDSVESRFFTKDQLIDFILDRYNSGSPLTRIILLDGGHIITPSVAQNLAEIIIERAKSKSIIEPNETMSLSEVFKITAHNNK